MNYPKYDNMISVAFRDVKNTNTFNDDLLPILKYLNDF